MTTNVISRDAELVRKSNELYGSQKITYLAFTPSLCGNRKPYQSTGLMETKHHNVTWQLAQRFPNDDFLQAIKATQTEFTQVHGKPTKFSYTQFSYAIEFTYMLSQGISNIDGIKAETINNMLMQWDNLAYNGDGVNVGIIDNPNAEKIEQLDYHGTYDSLKTCVGTAIKRLRAATGITSRDYHNVQLSHCSHIYDILTDTDNHNVSNQERLQKSYSGIKFVETPSNLSSSDAPEFILSYKPMVTLHHGAMPSIDSTEKGKYGKSENTLFGADSTGVEIEKKGAIQLVSLKWAKGTK